MIDIYNADSIYLSNRLSEEQEDILMFPQIQNIDTIGCVPNSLSVLKIYNLH